MNATSTYDLPANTTIWMDEQTSYDGNSAAVKVNNWDQNLGSYVVATARVNMAQGETSYGDDWMGGGGSGSTYQMYFQPVGSYPLGWNHWGEFTGCQPYNGSLTGAPFDYTVACNLSGTTYEWRNGGNGNGDFGS